MRFIKQNKLLLIRNVDFTLSMSKEKKKHGSLLNTNIRGIVCGPSGCGKTKVIIGLLEHPNGLKFENVYIYSKSLHQP